MKAKIAGVALAAVVGACAVGGGAERAEALTYNILGLKDPGYFGYTVGDQPILNFDINTRFRDFVDATVTIGNKSQFFSGLYFNNIDEYQDHNNPYNDLQIDDISLPSVVPSFSLEIMTGLNGGEPFGPGGFGLCFASGYCTSGGISAFQTDPVAPVSPVPLPASAPLLGAALLALGGIGYARRRAVV